MTKESKAPREFWLYKETAILCENRNINIHDQHLFERLVNYSAYAALEAKLALCLNALERHSDNCMRQLDGCYLCAALAKIKGENDKE